MCPIREAVNERKLLDAMERKILSGSGKERRYNSMEKVMKEEKEPQEEPVEPADEPKAAPKQKSSSFTVTDQGEHGYDNDGPFGIGQIKGVK